ncbi:Nuclear rim protein 1 [Madurella mycetomatis]|uniref:Nuclear rim protein 1 n=1 Tax=Madurella mycetomatis TaxID=100816 RepID=A0A175VVV9_9PEZI|nr:Nuclear rim protein 1 [Madurella mycetomatis]
MPPRPQRLVRRRPLGERLRSALNPMDFYLWLSEEIQTFNWDSKAFGTRFGLVANFIFLLARANAAGTNEAIDDVFGDAPANGWVTLLANFLLWTLTSISVLNAFYTMTRSRTYRLFEMNVEAAGPGTPSAQRVRVDSSPASSTPVRLIQTVLRPETAEQRAHPDKTRDVWEMRVWDPYPATLRMFCLFSPGHVLIHMLFLPLPPLDPRPSVTVFKCLVLQAILSAQLLLMHSRFSQQSKDTAIIQKEVMHEYDVKYVHPQLHPVVREVATQVSISDGRIDQEAVMVGTPATVVRRAFQTHPNPNYAKHFDPDAGQPPQRTTMSPSPFTPTKPVTPVPLSFTAQLQQRQSAVRRSLPPVASGAVDPLTPSGLTKTTSTGTSTGTNINPPVGSGLGGSLGIYTHVNSPLKKATSLGDMKNGAPPFSPRNSREMAALEQRELAERMVRQSSPLKDSSWRSATTQADMSSFMHSPDKLAKARANRWTQERFPTRRV